MAAEPPVHRLQIVLPGAVPVAHRQDRRLIKRRWRPAWALAYRARGRDEAAAAELEQVVARRDEALGTGHPDTLAARHELALSYFHMSPGSGNPAWLSNAIATIAAGDCGNG